MRQFQTIDRYEFLLNFLGCLIMPFQSLFPGKYWDTLPSSDCACWVIIDSIGHQPRPGTAATKDILFLSIGTSYSHLNTKRFYNWQLFTYVDIETQRYTSRLTWYLKYLSIRHHSMTQVRVPTEKNNMDNLVLLRERKRHTARHVVSTSFSCHYLGWPPPPRADPPGWLTPPPADWPTPADWPDTPPSVGLTPPKLTDLTPPPSWTDPSPRMGLTPPRMDSPPPRCGQTNKVKRITFRRTTYAGGNIYYFGRRICSAKDLFQVMFFQRCTCSWIYLDPSVFVVRIRMLHIRQENVHCRIGVPLFWPC